MFKFIAKQLKRKITIFGFLGLMLFGVFSGAATIISTQNEQTCIVSASTTNPSDGNVKGGTWQEDGTEINNNVKYAIERFKSLGMSGNNIAAVIAIGIRESGFNVKSINPSGHVKGIFQWGFGGVNGNRYGNTQDTIEGQIGLTISELNRSHKMALIGLSKSNDIVSSAVQWDGYFEGVLGQTITETNWRSNSQTKPNLIIATANAVKEKFNLNFTGNIQIPVIGENIGDDLTPITTADQQDCSTTDTTTSGLPVTGLYSVTGGFPFYQGITGDSHQGVDFQSTSAYGKLDPGKDGYVYSVADGTVVQKGFNALGGNYVLIKSTDGMYEYYAHAPSLDDISVEVGDEVTKGQQISVQGQTGNVTGTHVHFGLYKDASMSDSAMVSPGTYLTSLPKSIIQNNGRVVIPGGPFDTNKGDN